METRRTRILNNFNGILYIVKNARKWRAAKSPAAGRVL